MVGLRKLPSPEFPKQFLNISFSFSNDNYISATIFKIFLKYYSNKSQIFLKWQLYLCRDLQNISKTKSHLTAPHHVFVFVFVFVFVVTLATPHHKISRKRNLTSRLLTSPQVQWRPNPFSPFARTASSWNTLDSCELFKIKQQHWKRQLLKIEIILICLKYLLRLEHNHFLFFICATLLASIIEFPPISS